MPELNIQQKVINFVTEHPEYQGKPADTVLSVMLNLGKITQAEVDSLKPNEEISAFGFGFNTEYPYKNPFDITSTNKKEISTTPASTTQRKTSNLIYSRNKEARESFEAQLKQLGWAGEVADFFKSFGKNNEEEVRADLEAAESQAQQLKFAAEESADAFKAKFKEIYGVDYNVKNIELYEQAEIFYKEALNARTIENFFNTTFDKLLNQDLADEYKTIGATIAGTVQTIKIPKEEIYEEYFNKFAEILGEDGKDVLNEYIKQAQAEDFALYGFAAGTGTLEYKWNLLQQLAKGYSAQYAKATKEACRGSKFEDIQARYEKAYTQAFGTKNDIIKRVNDYNISQVKGAGYVKAGSLMLIMLASTFIPMIGAGAAGASVGAGAGAAATAAGKGALLLSIAKSAGTVAAISAGLEITDRFTTREAREALKKDGVLKYLETANENTDWSQIAKASLSAGAMCVVFGGISYALTNVTIKTCLAGGMSNLGSAYTAAGVSTAGTVATGLGIEYLATGEISVEGVIFTVTMAVIGGVTQVVNIQKQSTVLQKDAQLALEVLGIEDVSDLTVAEARNRAQAILLKMAGVDDMANISAQEAKTIIQNYSSNFPTITDMNNFNRVLKAYSFFSNNLKDIQFLVSTGKIDLSNTARTEYYYRNPVNSPLMLTAPAENSFTQFGQVRALPQPVKTNYPPASAYVVAAEVSSIPIGDISSQTILGQTALSLASANSTLLASNPNFTSPIVNEIVSAIPDSSTSVEVASTVTQGEVSTNLENFKFDTHMYANTNEYVDKYVPIKKALHKRRMEVYGKTEARTEPRQVSKAEIKAIQDVQFEMGEYFNVQEKLRKGEVLNKKEQKFFDSVLDAMEPTKQKRTLWRSIEYFDGLQEQIRTGRIVSKALSSTSSRYSDFYSHWTGEDYTRTADGILITEGCMLKINVPEGTQLLDCNGTYEPFIGKTQYPRMYDEVVLPPGEFVIKSYDPELKIFEVDFIPEGKPSPSTLDMQVAPTKQVDNSAKTVIPEYVSPKVEEISIVPEESICTSETEQTPIKNSVVDFSITQKQVRELLQNTSCSNSEYRKILVILQEHPEKVDTIINFLKESKKTEATIRYLAEFFSENINNPINEILLEYVSVNNCEFTKEIYTKILQEAKQENVQIALEIVKQTQAQVGRFSLESFEKLCFMEISEPQARIDLLNSPCFKEIFNKSYYYVDKQTIIETFFNAEPEKIYTITKHFKKMNNDKTISEKEFFNLFNCSIEQIEAIDYLLTDPTFQWYCSEHHSFIKYENFMKLSPESIRKLKDYKIFDIVKDKNIDSKEIYKLSEADLDNIYILNEMKDYSLRPHILFSMTSTQLDCVAKLMKIKYPIKYAGGILQDRQYSDCMNDILNCDEDTLIEITKLACLTKEDGSTLIDIKDIRSLFTTNYEVSKLVVQRYLENPNSKPEDIQRLLNTPLKQLKNPELAVSAEEEILNQTFQFLCKSRHFSSETDIYRCCSREDGSLDENAVNILSDYTEFSYYDDAHIIKVIKAFQTKDGSYDFEKYLRTKKYLEDNGLAINKYLILGAKCTNLETTFPQIIINMDSFVNNVRLETYSANSDEELIEMSRILKEDKTTPYNFYILVKTINENPEKAYLLLKAYDTLSKGDDISAYLSILTPEYIDDDFKMIDLISELNKFTRPYSIVNIVQDLAPQLASVEFLDSAIEIAQLLNSTYKNAEYTFKFDSIIRNLTPENIPVIKMLLQKFNGTTSVNDPKQGVIENAVISDSTLEEVSEIRDPKELEIIVDMIENDILPITTNYSSNGNLLLIFKDTLKAILKYPEIFEAAKNVKSPYAINLFEGYANFNGRFSMILAELNSEQKEGLYKILSCSTDDGWRTRTEFIDNINLELFKKLSPEQYEYLNIILDNCAENDSFYALSKIIGQIYDLASNVRAENAELFIKLIKHNTGRNYKSITKILQGQQTYDKKGFQELLALVDQETPALAVTTFSEVVSKPYNPELHKYILENIHKEDPDFTMSGIINYLSATGSDLEMIEYIRNSNEFYAVVLKQQSDFLERTERTCLILFDEILKEIRSTGKTRMNTATAEILWDKDFDTDLFKKLYNLKDSDGNYIIHGQEMVKLLDNREIALKILNESTESVPKLNLENITISDAQVKSFFENLPNIYKIILANDNGEFGIAEYKEVLKKLNQNQFLRDALAEFEKTGKIDLAQISDQSILQIMLTNSTNTLAIAQVLPDLVESNPLAVRKIQSDVEDIIDFYLEKTRTFFEANPGQIPGNISPEKMVEVFAGAIWQETKTLKNIIDVLDLVGKERFIQSIDNVDNPYRNEFNLSHFESILGKEYTPLLKEVFALKDFSSQDIDLIIQISKYTIPHYESITITSRDFNEILKAIKKQGFLDRKNLVTQLYDAILNSNIENFEKMTEQELKIVAEYNLIDCPNVKVQQWKDFANLPEEIRPIIIKLLENNEYQRIKKLLTISDQEIENLHYKEKVDLVNIANKISDKDMVILQQSGTNVVDRITKISRMLEIPKMYIPTDLSSQRNFISNILSNRSGFESIISAIDLTSETFKDGIPLKYSRESFISDIKSLMENLPVEEQSNLLKHFGLEDSGSGIEGLPIVNKDFTNLPEDLHTTASEIANKIQQFIYENETTIADPKVKESLDALIKGFPEFTSIIGKVQHGTHAYTVDIHTLKVLQTCIEDPNYAKLSDQDKFVLKFAVLMHDFGKKERTIDQGHQHLSSDYAYGILSKYNLPDSVKYRIMEIVDNHHWFEAYCTGKLNAEQVMATFRDPANFDIAKIFARADFMGVNENFHIGRSNVSTQEEFEEYIKTKFSYVDEKFNFTMSHANFILDTKFLYNGANFPKEKVIIDGVEHEIPVLNLTSPDLGNLEQYGFPKGTKLEDVRFLVHMPNGGNKIYTWMQMYNFWNNIPKNESIQSVSMISMAHKETYYGKGFGFILDVDQANISTADDHNVGSGYAKDVKGLARRYFEYNNSPLVRNSFLKRSKELGYDITEEDYKLISKFLYTVKHITAIYSEGVHSENKTYVFRPDGKVQISNSGDTSKSDGCVRIKAKDLREILEGSRDRLQGSASHSELVIYRPRVIGLFAKTSNITECPEDFLRFAIDNNYPIILIGN